MNRCMIIAGGPIGDYGRICSKIRFRAQDYIICVDGGISHAAGLGVSPDLMVGDMDSAARIPAGIKTLRYQSEKDETDTILAIQYALKEGYRDITIVGGLRGRLDHTMANIEALLYLTRNGGSGRIVDSDNEACLLMEGKMTFSKRENTYFSVFPLFESAEGVTEKGFKYALDRATLKSSFPLGVSNEFKEDQAEISVERGPLLIILSEEIHEKNKTPYNVNGM